MILGAADAVTAGASAVQGFKINNENAKFSQLLNELNYRNESSLSSSQITENGRLNGDYSPVFKSTNASKNEKEASAQGAAVNQNNVKGVSKRIDKTSKLYEKSLELEYYFVKQVVSSMRKTLMKSSKSDFAGQMYDDMLFDEYTSAMTKKAGFGLADQIYLQLSQKV